ncbi:MAG: SDR family NAD(P)-dependent oxidoreductase [bacterium]|nr:short-chain dehydrogenase [Deltaproteobacteria bacterium]MCP4904982.1 SDR family NAD(P)-dependent oxidoreductase [bacterium]
MNLEGKAAVVAGSSRGIGRAVALALAAEGAAVVVNGRLAGAVEDVTSEIRATGARAEALVGSASDFRIARELIECCVDQFRGIDILVNCVGISEPEGSSILNLTSEAWTELIDSHLTATFNTCRHAAPLMVKQRAGSIVNTSSHAYLGYYGGTGYPAGKGGVNSLTFAIAAELHEHGVRANAVCPGARTRLNTGPQYEAKILELHRRGIMDDHQRDLSLSPTAPELVGPLYVYLSSELSSQVTGHVFTASGGYVGVHATLGKETLLAFRDAVAGPWPLGELAEEISTHFESTP